MTLPAAFLQCREGSCCGGSVFGFHGLMERSSDRIGFRQPVSECGIEFCSVFILGESSAGFVKAFLQLPCLLVSDQIRMIAGSFPVRCSTEFQIVEVTVDTCHRGGERF